MYFKLLFTILFLFWATAFTLAERCSIIVEGVERSHKVLTFVDSSYFSLFHNWLVHYNQTCGIPVNATITYPNLLPVCMDEQVGEMLSPLGLSCSSFSSNIWGKATGRKRPVGNVWLRRMQIIIELLEAGEDVLLTDTDAFWLQDPFPSIATLIPSAHIISSRGTFPAELSREWGSTLCMGFIFIRSDDFTINFFRMVLEIMAAVKSPDDQYTVNKVLHSLGISWVASATKRTIGIGTIDIDNSTFTVALLPEEKFLRRCIDPSLATKTDEIATLSTQLNTSIVERLSQAIVAHCLLAPGDAKKKATYLQFYSLWRLPAILSSQDLGVISKAITTQAIRRMKLVSSTITHQKKSTTSSKASVPARRPPIVSSKYVDKSFLIKSRPLSEDASRKKVKRDYLLSRNTNYTRPSGRTKSIFTEQSPSMRTSLEMKGANQTTRPKVSMVPPLLSKPGKETSSIPSTSELELSEEFEDVTEEYSPRESRARSQWNALMIDGRPIFPVRQVGGRKRRKNGPR